MVNFKIGEIRRLMEHRDRIEAYVKSKRREQRHEFSEEEIADFKDAIFLFDEHVEVTNITKKRRYVTVVDCPSFATLPTEIWLKILLWLARSPYRKALARLARLGQTCRRMQPLVASKLYFHVTIRSSDRLRDFADTVASNPGLAGLKRNFTDNVGEPHGHQLRRICGACSNLLSLYLGCCSSLTDKALRDIAYRSTRLKSLTINFARNITDDGLANVGKHCAALEYLKVINGFNLTDRSIIQISDGCPLLRDVILRGCSNITAQSIKHLMLGAKRLRYLILEDNDDPSEAEVRTSRPEGLIIHTGRVI
ncbi:hypothetical protein HDU89_008645 [Geranomyces variabilis]|nr:hypothetical protein HDU89_008645 [Geranomyces variabilis]